MREKLIQVLRDNIEYELRHYPDDNYVEVAFNYEAIADALIAAGVGDVEKAKKEVNYWKSEVKTARVDIDDERDERRQNRQRGVADV